jgi:hypothetical protein
MITVTAKNEDFFREPRMNRVIVLDSLNYVWHREDLKRLKRMKAKGLAVEEMVYEFDRDPDEVLLALLHLKTSEDIRYRYPFVIILEFLDFLWDWSELRELIIIWERGLSIKYAANYFERDQGDIIIGIMHLSRIGKIKRRRGGLF